MDSAWHAAIRHCRSPGPPNDLLTGVSLWCLVQLEVPQDSRQSAFFESLQKQLAATASPDTSTSKPASPGLLNRR
jgi:hypothetical protein